MSEKTQLLWQAAIFVAIAVNLSVLSAIRSSEREHLAAIAEMVFAILATAGALHYLAVWLAR